MVVIRDENGDKLRELPVGSVFLPTGSKPDLSGMIDGTCNGDVALLFVRDLAERAEPVAIEKREVRSGDALSRSKQRVNV